MRSAAHRTGTTGTTAVVAPAAPAPKSDYTDFRDRLTTMELPDDLGKLRAFQTALVEGPRLAAAAPAPRRKRHRRTPEDFFTAAYLAALGTDAPDPATVAADLAEVGSFFRTLGEAPAVKDPHAARQLTTTLLARFQRESPTIGVNWLSINGRNFLNLADAVMAALIGQKSVGKESDAQVGEQEVTNKDAAA